MDFNFVSKNNMGIVITLVLVILLSQSKIFNFLTETYLGKMFILCLIILISYTNQFLGLLAVLFIIIAFNYYDMNVVRSYNYYEGFDGSGNSISRANINDNISNEEAKEDRIKQKASVLQNQDNTDQIATTTSNDTSRNTNMNSGTSESFGGREGFCMTDRETNILRGKQSNSIQVFNNTRNQDDDVSPTDKLVFSNLYTSF